MDFKTLDEYFLGVASRSLAAAEREVPRRPRRGHEESLKEKEAEAE